MMTAELALEDRVRFSPRPNTKQLAASTHMQATPRMAATAIFVRLDICKSRTRKMGKMPTVKSHMPAKTLQSQLIAMMTVQLMQWPS